MRKLGSLTVCGLTYTVMSADSCDKDNPLPEGASGYCDPEKQIIWIAEEDTRQAKVDTLIHEVLHAILSHSGLDQYIANTARIAVSSNLYHELEETIVSVMTPHLKLALANINRVKL